MSGQRCRQHRHPASSISANATKSTTPRATGSSSFSPLACKAWQGKHPSNTFASSGHSKTFRSRSRKTKPLASSATIDRAYPLCCIICGTLLPHGRQRATQGRIAALLELVSGFNPQFIGCKNVYMNAAMLSLSEEENGGERGHVKQSNTSASVVCAAFAPVVVKVVNYYLW